MDSTYALSQNKRVWTRRPRELCSLTAVFPDLRWVSAWVVSKKVCLWWETWMVVPDPVHGGHSCSHKMFDSLNKRGGTNVLRFTMIKSNQSTCCKWSLLTFPQHLFTITTVTQTLYIRVILMYSVRGSFHYLKSFIYFIVYMKHRSDVLTFIKIV